MAQAADTHTADWALEPFLLDLIIILFTAKVFGDVAKRVGIPVVLGELLGGAIIGVYGLGFLDISPIIHLLGQIGLIILLFEIGLETDIAELVKLGPRSMAVAAVGIIVPLAGGYFFAQAVGLPPLAALLIGGAFSATSIGISVRALAELGEQKSTEGQIVLGAALIDDVIGLLLLSVITALMAQQSGGAGNSQNLMQVILLTLSFPVVAFILGVTLTKPLLYWVDRMTVRGAIVIVSLVMALGFAWLASLFGTSPIIGAFAAGLILARTHRADAIEQQLKPISDVFTPIFFVSIGAAMNIQLLNPFNADNHHILLIALGASTVAFGTKIISGFAAYGKGIRKLMVGVSMAPRGEVVLIFAQLGLAASLIDSDWFAILIIVIATTAMISPLLLKLVLGKMHRVQKIRSYCEIDLAGYESEQRL